MIRNKVVPVTGKNNQNALYTCVKLSKEKITISCSYSIRKILMDWKPVLTCRYLKEEISLICTILKNEKFLYVWNYFKT